MDTMIRLLNDACAAVDDIRKDAQGFDPVLLLEAAMLTADDFSELMDGEALIAALKKEGLL